MERPGRVHGKVAIVTGAAMGIGSACARLLAREGAKVVVTDLDATGGEATAKAIRAAGGEATFVKHDVASENEWKNVIASALQAFERVDVLVNNAGIGTTGNVADATLDQWRKLMSINCDGVFLGTKYVFPAMKRAGGGSIINMSSILGMVGQGDAAAYCASKGAIRLLAKSAALHGAPHRIRVNSIHPGYIETPMVAHYVASTGDEQAARRALADLHPLGHLGEPDDIAYGVLYLASDESKFVTGSELVIDGGYTAR
ncbi:MAG TPA: glucose 1-dehydrogenase [Candidatus Dormibacteraeota bacterium]|nr:glucose 1-dehydrogenase [Candidatus Dormibacteraeota bacterium]